MRYRPFGTTGLRVSEVFLGAMTLGEQGGVGAPLEECRRMIDASQVAIARTMARSEFVHPIVGARRLGQLTDNLGAVDIDLPTEAVEELDDATGFTPGFPTEFIDETTPWVFAAAAADVDRRRCRQL